MAFQPCNGVIKVAINGQAQGETCVNTLYFRTTDATAPSAARVAGVTEAVALHWIDVMLGSLPSQYTLLSVEGTSLHTEAAPASLYVPETPPVGELGGDCAPNNVSLAIKFSTGLTGRSSRGRNFWPLFIENELTNNRVDTARAAAIVASYSDFIGDGTFYVGVFWGVLSRYHNNEPRGIGLCTPISAVSLTDTVVDSMRRRLPKRGV